MTKGESELKSVERGMLVIFVLLALLVRLYEKQFHPLIASDGITFIGLAQNLFSGRYGDTFRSLHHHLFYPFLMKVFSFVGGYESAGAVISLLLGSLLVIPVFLLAREFYGTRAGYISSLLIVFDRLLVNFSTEVLSESTYLFLLFLGIYLGWMALEKRRWSLYAGASLSLTLSYLTRPEGLVGLAIIFVWTLISMRFFQQLPWRKAAVTFLMMGAIFAMVSSPYLFFLHQELGHWTPSGKLYRLRAYKMRDGTRGWLTLTDGGKQVFTAAVYDLHSEVAQEIKEKGKSSLVTNLKEGQIKKSLKDSINLIIFMAFPWIVILVIIGLFRSGWDRVRLKKELYLVSFFAFTPLLYSFLFQPRARHLLLTLPLIAVWAGKGLEELVSWVSESIGKFGFSSSPVRERRLRIILIFIILVPSLFLIFNPGRKKPSTAAKEVGLWMKENLSPKPVIMSTNSQVSYYAGSGVPVLSPYADDLSKTLDYARYHNVEYIVVDRESTHRLTPQLQFLLDELKAPPDKLRLVYKYINQSGENFLIYELLE